jgi:hypothetical protein
MRKRGSLFAPATGALPACRQDDAATNGQCNLERRGTGLTGPLRSRCASVSRRSSAKEMRSGRSSTSMTRSAWTIEEAVAQDDSIQRRRCPRISFVGGRYRSVLGGHRLDHAELAGSGRCSASRGRRQRTSSLPCPAWPLPPARLNLRRVGERT